MTTNTVTLSYHNHDLSGLLIDGQIWLRVAQIAPPLGAASERRVREIYERHADEFGSDETRLLTLPTDGGDQEIRVFSLRGARLLAFFAKTEPAKSFRRWVLDVLDGRVLRIGIPALIARAGAVPLSLDAKLALKHAVEMLETEEPDAVRARLQGILSGQFVLPSDPRLMSHAEAWERGSQFQRMANEEHARIRRMAALDGWSETAIKAEVSRRRRLGLKQREMAFDGGEGGDEAGSCVTNDGAGNLLEVETPEIGEN